MIKEVKIIEWTLDKDKLDEIVNEVETEVKEKLEKEKKPSEEKMTEKGEEMTEKVEEKPEKEPEVDSNSFEELLAKFRDNIGTLKSGDVKPEEFEKDDDKNWHIDAIYSMANCRGECYK